jgi:hypothetical protein
MGRVNKTTAGVFTDIIGDQKENPTYNQFLSIQDLLKKPSEELSKLLETYRFTVNNCKGILEQLGKLEDVIMQIRTRDNLTTKDIKLNVVREYIYARVPFHRKDKETKDIRVIVGQTDEWGTDVTKLLGSKKFVAIAKEKLTSAMNVVITESTELLEKIWSNEKDK